MRLITEQQSSALVSHQLAYVAAREALIAAASPEALIFPAVIAQLSPDGRRFSVKSSATPDVAGLKVGSFWPNNDALGLARHGSAIFLLDQVNGRIAWVIEASKANAYRTAAADAVAADLLARTDASVLAIFGAGHQARYERKAISLVRGIGTVLIVARDPGKAAIFIEELRAEGVDALAVDARSACAEADIIVTATPARSPLFDAAWIRPGTHVAGMGSDAAGKQELPPALFDRAALFCDLPAQSLVLGEYQYFKGDPVRITAIGAALTGQASGRLADDDITVFDSSGLSLQDLYIARHLVAAFEC